ncbi:NAD-dependent epimerase [Streptomyces albus subsp. chlorinus]|uniref:NAD-dependent epimerase n=1 Tax=Streptomyces albus subsp. chlorinus TaxID=337066 RepID=A0A3G4YJK7_9ACTN|nr:NAD-dependent epimerase [Streptomyces albus subsp. chlorinus]UZN59878.1 NAD-dependent epimerase [Streptomyces albus subsp. chlorinus] [Streptomyces sp. GBA 94-10 4N24]UZQ37607.1 NAD-dependent epimerase [Streptomyces albus subsp. chlorinus] [Streptomyces sp. Je 1-4 4N24]UZQ45024.1 NAD-dependent epimerase [Streptomyces albus subsp. chlorinus] [Streptomyces sp. Je 1-4 4N24_ara]WAE19991.1 NAD-dependent epimerase [Streptomyces albus subsp. chlorinus] [Streptomyces albidoflavus]
MFGANSSTGRHLTEQALGAGHTVTAVVRRPEAFPLSGPQLRVHAADVFDKAAVEEAVAGSEAVISILGVPYQRKPVTVLSRGITHITDAMAAHGVKRLVAVTSRLLAVHAPRSEGEKPLYERFVYRRLLYPFLTTLGRTLYDDMLRMEHIVRATELDWTLVRPSALYNTDVVSDYHFGPPESPGLYTSRIDLAHSLLHEVTENSHVRSVVSVFTTEGVPTFGDVLKKEVMRIGSWEHK